MGGREWGVVETVAGEGILGLKVFKCLDLPSAKKVSPQQNSDPVWNL